MHSNQLKVGSPLMFKSKESTEPYSFINPKQEQTSYDRFIPNRLASNLNKMFFSDIENYENQQQEQYDYTREDQNQKNYSNLLQTHVLGQIPGTDNQIGKRFQGLECSGKKKMLRFSSQKYNSENNPYIFSPLQINGKSISSCLENKTRRISKQPYKVLDAPSLQDDFYLNLLDWSSNNFISIGLENELYIWSACTSKVTKLCELQEPNMICSCAWSPRGNHIAIGDISGSIKLFDTVKQKLVKTIPGHQSRIGSLSWNGYLLASGSRDRNILVRDIRTPDIFQQKYMGHKQEICGLKWSFDENLLASGGNDNKVFVWSLKNNGELERFGNHCAAVKAVGWSPHQHNILATGGGTADRTIRFWNTSLLHQVDQIDTGSQVCNLSFSKNVNEIVSTHGYSLNQIIVWKYPSMQKISTLSGHTMRVLYLAMSPCGQNVVTGAGDETLRFWNVFPPLKNKGQEILGIRNLMPAAHDLR